MERKCNARLRLSLRLLLLPCLASSDDAILKNTVFPWIEGKVAFYHCSALFHLAYYRIFRSYFALPRVTQCYIATALRSLHRCIETYQDITMYDTNIFMQLYNADIAKMHSNISGYYSTTYISLQLFNALMHRCIGT